MSPAISEPDPIVIKQALQDVLQSPSFRSSKQCQALLRYIVLHSLAHDENLLRERVIGTNVFERAPDYDTGNDPVVRSRAAEVRKRLAQHYLWQGSTPGGIRIDIPSGSYRAVFKKPESTDGWRSSERAGMVSSTQQNLEAVSSEHVNEAPLAAGLISSPKVAVKSYLRWTLAIGISVLVLVSLIGFVSRRRPVNSNEREFSLFWVPILQSSKPTVVYIGANYSYRLTSAFLDRYRLQHHLENTGPEFFIELKRGNTIDEGDLIPTNRFIGFGDVAAAGRIISTLTHLGKRYDLRYGNDIAVTDIHSSPALLIGGFSNAWTLRVMHDLRFTLEQGDRIIDRQHNDKVWIKRATPDLTNQDDYAVISRLLKSETGGFVITIAGIDTYGNQAAADFLGDPDQIGALLASAPADWDKKSLQIVLHTSVVNDVPVSSNVEAVYYW